MNYSRIVVKQELIAGVTTFFTMTYIVIVNPSILATNGTGMSFSGVLTATVLLSFSMSLFMGLYAKLPYAVAPGMGINAFFTFSVILGKQIPWQIALGAVFWAGVLFLILSLTPLRVLIAQSIPRNLRISCSVGIGIFLTFIGLKNAGLITSDLATFVKPAALNKTNLLSLGGLFLILWFQRRKNPLSFLSGIFCITIISLLLGWTPLPNHYFQLPDFESVFLKADPIGALKLSLLPIIFSILFTDLFDSISTFIGIAQAGGNSSGLLLNDGNPKNLREGLIVDSFATFGASLFGTSSGTAYLESAAGVETGGRTGLTAIVTALCFLPCFFIAPLAAAIPAYATAPVLIILGSMMFRSVGELKLVKLEDVFPAFITIALIPLTFSITQGIAWGIISHTVLFIFANRKNEIPKTLYIITAVCILALLFN